MYQLLDIYDIIKINSNSFKVKLPCSINDFIFKIFI